MAIRGKRAEINLEEVEKLAAMQATDADLAAFFNVTTRTIERRRLEPEFAEALERGKNKGRLTIRRAQLKLLEAGNTAMAIWLGKNYLGQTDRTEVNTAPGAQPSLKELSGKQLIQLFNGLTKQQIEEISTEVKALSFGRSNSDELAALPAPEDSSDYEEDQG
jgi:hypothetical protein